VPASPQASTTLQYALAFKGSKADTKYVPDALGLHCASPVALTVISLGPLVPLQVLQVTEIGTGEDDEE
jgi:hypothetical protein